MGTSLSGNDKRTESEPEYGLGKTFRASRRLEQDVTPQTFLNRCKEIVSKNIKAVSPAIRIVPIATKAKVAEFKPKVRQIGELKRKLPLGVPSWNESSVRRTEIILGAALVVIAILFLNDPGQELAALSNGWESTLASIFQKGNVQSAEMPLLAPMPDSRNAASVNNSLPCSSFHSFADPARRFSFDQEPGWTSNSMMSTQAACGVANHLQHHAMDPSRSVPSRNSSTLLPSEQLNLLQPNSPLHVQKQSFEKYVSTNRLNPGAAPLNNIMSRFRNMSQALNDACGPAPSGSGEGDGGSGGGEE